jgi:hypothetical protein
MECVKASKPKTAQKLSRAQIAAQQEQLRQEAAAGLTRLNIFIC